MSRSSWIRFAFGALVIAAFAAVPGSALAKKGETVEVITPRGSKVTFKIMEIKAA